jgi:hypothetical protein
MCPVVVRIEADGWRRSQTLMCGLLPLALVALTLRAIVAWSLPLDASDAIRECAPDERGHLDIVQLIAAGEVPLYPENTTSAYAALSPAPYFVHAAFYALGRHLSHVESLYRFPPRTAAGDGYLFARAGSVLLGVLTVLFLAGGAYVWTGAVGVALNTATVATLYPQLVFVGGYSNADSFTIAAGALVVLMLARWARAGEGRRGLVPLAFALGLVVLGKPSGHFLLVTTGGWIAAMVVAGRVNRDAARRAVLVFLATCVPLLAWNAWRNGGGDALGLRHYADWLASLRHPFLPGTAVPDAFRLFVEWLSFSSFGLFRNLDLHLPLGLYLVAYSFLIVGLVVGSRGVRAADPTDRRGLLWLGASCLLNLGLVVYNCWFVGFSPQGRYVLLMVVLLTAIAVSAPGRSAPHGFWRAWPYLYGTLLAFSVIWSIALIYGNPCVATA